MTSRAGSNGPAPGEGSALTDLVVITGFSGAGKSTAMAAFEDDGYFCVDNLPPEMIRSLVDLFMHAGSKVARAAVVSDARGGSYFEGLAAMLDDLRTSGVRHRILFLEADEETLLTRYKETRRRHPLAPSGSVADGIRRERELLAPLRERADVVIDTSRLTRGDAAAQAHRGAAADKEPGTPGGHVPELRLQVRLQPRRRPAVRRPLPAQPALRARPAAVHREPTTGSSSYINRDGALDVFYEHLHPLLDYLLPQYLAEGKAHLVVAIGCTGGRHRSVAIAQHLAERYAGRQGYLVDVLHRDVGEPA